MAPNFVRERNAKMENQTQMKTRIVLDSLSGTTYKKRICFERRENLKPIVPEPGHWIWERTGVAREDVLQLIGDLGLTDGASTIYADDVLTLDGERFTTYVGVSSLFSKSY
jgi:hypothetical protein